MNTKQDPKTRQQSSTGYAATLTWKCHHKVLIIKICLSTGSNWWRRIDIPCSQEVKIISPAPRK